MQRRSPVAEGSADVLRSFGNEQAQPAAVLRISPLPKPPVSLACGDFQRWTADLLTVSCGQSSTLSDFDHVLQ
jgi:hypothetical protein